MTWKSLNHPNLLTPLGVTMNGKRLGLVSEWMVNGSVNEFVKFNPGADRFELVGCHSCFSPRPALMFIPSGSSKASPGD